MDPNVLTGSGDLGIDTFGSPYSTSTDGLVGHCQAPGPALCRWSVGGRDHTPQFGNGQLEGTAPLDTKANLAGGGEHHLGALTSSDIYSFQFICICYFICLNNHQRPG